MLTPAEAAALIHESMRLLPKEQCGIADAHGRVLRSDLRADRDLPPFDRVTLDGYALRASALTAGARTFKVKQQQRAGAAIRQLEAAANACVEVMTGAVLPGGADVVVPYEMSRREGDVMTLIGNGVNLVEGHAIHRQGSDRRAGEVIVRSGTRLTAREIAVAAACGHSVLEVSCLPRIAVVATGDELVEVGGPVAEQQIRRSNDHALRAAMILAGYPQVDRFHLRDERETEEGKMQGILAAYDVAVFTGGVSKGRFDLLPEELPRHGVKKVLHGVAQRPGKPMWFGIGERQNAVFGLPGNPVSAFTCLHRYVLPALARASGETEATLRQVRLAERVIFREALALFLPVTLRSGVHAEWLATPRRPNTSGDLAALLGTDGFVELAAEQEEFAADTLASFWPW